MERVQSSESTDRGWGQPMKAPSQAHPGLQQGGPLLRGSALLVLVQLMVSSERGAQLPASDSGEPVTFSWCPYLLSDLLAISLWSAVVSLPALGWGLRLPGGQTSASPPPHLLRL